jgi:hypothetical protein
LHFGRSAVFKAGKGRGLIGLSPTPHACEANKKHSFANQGMEKYIHKIKIYHLMAFHAIVSALVIYFFDGTGDAGDSIGHYLYAKYAPQHPRLFFNHWAKPIYVLLFRPFAQFGFIGVKIANAILANATIFFTWRVAKTFNLPNPLISGVFILFSPLYFVLTFSGLTDILFGFVLILCIDLYTRNRRILSLVILSFLPFVRSEGIIIIGVFGLLTLLERKWKLLPLLAIGHVVYSLAGLSVYDDLLWVFTKVPYLNLEDHYGSGKPFHFVKNLIYVVGVPIYLVFWLGVIKIIVDGAKRRIRDDFIILIGIGFLAFLVAHSIFWALGIFNSMGLIRVMIGVMPLIALISLYGFNTILSLPKSYATLHAVALILYVLIFPFTSNKAAVKWDRDLSLNADQIIAKRVAMKIEADGYQTDRFVYIHPYLSMCLDWDPFVYDKRLELSKPALEEMKKGDIVIWENWFAVVERKVSKEMLLENERLDFVFEMDTTARGRIIEYAVFKVIK